MLDIPFQVDHNRLVGQFKSLPLTKGELEGVVAVAKSLLQPLPTSPSKGEEQTDCPQSKSVSASSR